MMCSGGFEVASSPVVCLAKAIDDKPSIIVIHFPEGAIEEREVLVELCDVLKRTSPTRDKPLLALLPTRHRKLLEKLDQARVDYVKFITAMPLDLPHMTGMIESLGPGDLLKRQLERVCPFIHYSPIDTEREIIICGAYLDRLVLGSKCLHAICESETHLRCEYFRNPKVSS